VRSGRLVTTLASLLLLFAEELSQQVRHGGQKDVKRDRTTIVYTSSSDPCRRSTVAAVNNAFDVRKQVLRLATGVDTSNR